MMRLLLRRVRRARADGGLRAGLEDHGEAVERPHNDKFYVNESTKDFDVIDLIERTNWLFFGYMMDDLAHVLMPPRAGEDGHGRAPPGVRTVVVRRLHRRRGATRRSTCGSSRG